MRRFFHDALAIALIAVGCQTTVSAQNTKPGQTFQENTSRWADKVEQSYRRGITYLSSSQNEDGYWFGNSYGSEPGVVGLAIVAILAHGDDPNFGPHASTIKKGLSYIMSKTNKDTGYIGSSMYNHGFATLALAEAYGVVADPRLGPALRKAVDLILNSQKKNPKGAWRYSPESKDADVTVSGAQMVALFAARNAGLGIPNQAIEKGKEFMLKCQSSNGGFGYTSSSSPNAPRSAIGCLTLALNKDKDTKAYEKACEYIFSQEGSSLSHYRFYNLYYTSQAVFHASPEKWREWNANNINRLLPSQNKDSGSKDYGSWSGNYGKTFSTSAALLSLALNYRFLPIYER